ncbi:MAG TPA: hypothetical protein VF587_15885 [Solirubrobacteraceae bacterium]|jgi:hypothetical protein
MAEPSRQQNLAERNGPAILVFAGVVIALAAVAAVFSGHELFAGGLALPGVLSIALGALIARMEGPFSLFGVSGNLRPIDGPSTVARAASAEQLREVGSAGSNERGGTLLPAAVAVPNEPPGTQESDC